MLGVHGRWHLIEFSLQRIPTLATKAGLCEHVFCLYPQLLPVTLCYITPFNLADGHFPAHHPSSPLPFLSPVSPALLCTPPVSHLCPVPPHLSLHPCILPLCPLSALPTLLMSISHSWCSSRPSLSAFSQDTKSTCAAKLLYDSSDFLTLYTCSTGEKPLQTVSSTSVTPLTHFIPLPARWWTVCRDISRLHGAGLCHLSHTWEASPNQNGATWLPVAKWWEESTSWLVYVLFIK